MIEMLHPKYELKIGSITYKPDASNECINIHTVSSMDSPSDLFEGSFRIDGQASKTKKEDPVTVSLGYEDDLTQVFEGKIDELSHKMFDVNLTAFSSIFSLSTFRADKFYEQRTAGQIVTDLAKEAQVQQDEISDGVKFPYYAVDSNRNGYDHIQKLASICGFDIYFTNKNKLVFKKYVPPNKHKLSFGKNILKIKRIDNTPILKGIVVIGESPASLKGADTSHWIKKKPLRAVSGQDGQSLKIVNRAIKDDQTARKVAEENLNTIKSQLIVVIDVVGDPKIMLGDAAVIEGIPNKEMNGEFQIRTIEHYFSKNYGFVTSLKCRGKSGE